MSANDTKLVEVRGLRIEALSRAGGAPLLDDINLSLDAGEVLGLIGESGAGKSTLGLAVMGHVREGCRVTAGEILLHGENLLSFSRSRLLKLRGSMMAYIAQSPASAFNPSQTLGKQVAEVLLLHKGIAKKQAAIQAADLFAEMDLPSPATFGKNYPHQVSGGQLQRAMIAMAIACKPQILILDEPTTALDVSTQVEVLAAIRTTLKNHAVAALYISHDLAVVAQIAERLLVLRHGRMVETGGAADLINRPETDYTGNLMEAFSVTQRDLPAQAEVMPDAQTVLEIDDLTASYRSMPGVLKNISCSLSKGKTLAVVGMSGSGKSTLARAICGIVHIDSGAVRFNRQELPPSYQQRSREQMRAIQMVYQHPDTALNPQQTVGEIIGRGLKLYSGLSRRAVKDRVAEVLEMVGLPVDYAECKPIMLSGGQKQRVGIARALAASPELIICDEITSALDPLVAVEILHLLLDIQKKMGTTYLLITHDIGVVRRVADDVAVMHEGRVIAQGPLADVFGNPEHPYTRMLLASVPELRTDWLTEILSARDSLRGDGGGAGASVIKRGIRVEELADLQPETAARPQNCQPETIGRVSNG